MPPLAGLGRRATSFQAREPQQVTASGSDSGNGRVDRDAGLTAAAQARAPTEDFSSSLRELQDAVRSACAQHLEWEERVAAGIREALVFAGANPAKAHVLTIAARRPSAPEAEREEVVISHFTEVLGKGAPAKGCASISTDEGPVEAIATVVRGHLLAGTANRLPALAPDLVYLTLVPYVGLAAAGRWAELEETSLRYI
jgi:hypothetical protein